MSEFYEMTEKTAAILQEAATTFKERGGVYKDNHQRVGAVLAALFPDGITLMTEDEHERFALIMLNAVKMTRDAVAWPNGHQDSLRDMIVYSAMLEARTNGGNSNQPEQCGDRRSEDTKTPKSAAEPVVGILGASDEEEMLEKYRVEFLKRWR